MHKTLILAVVIGACACRPSQATNTPQARQPDLSVALRALRANLLATHATFDGARVTDLKPVSRCEAIITTPRGSTRVNWKGLESFARAFKMGGRWSA